LNEQREAEKSECEDKLKKQEDKLQKQKDDFDGKLAALELEHNERHEAETSEWENKLQRQRNYFDIKLGVLDDKLKEEKARREKELESQRLYFDLVIANIKVTHVNDIKAITEDMTATKMKLANSNVELAQVKVAYRMEKQALEEILLQGSHGNGSTNGPPCY